MTKRIRRRVLQKAEPLAYKDRELSVWKAALYGVLEGRCPMCYSLLEQGFCSHEGIQFQAIAAPMADGRPQVEVQLTFSGRQLIWGWNAEIGAYTFPSVPV